MTGIIVNFHGERGQQDVDIIDGFGDLRAAGYATISDPLKELRLAKPDLRSGLVFAQRLLLGSLVEEFFRKLSNRLVCLFAKAASLFRTGLRHSEIHRFGPVSLSYSKVVEMQGQAASRHIKGLGNGLHALAGIEPAFDLGKQPGSLSRTPQAKALRSRPAGYAISLEDLENGAKTNAKFSSDIVGRKAVRIFSDDIIFVEHNGYQGYVYNLEDSKSYYIGNGIVQHNRRCTMFMSEAPSH